jgi:hypothetical protein
MFMSETGNIEQLAKIVSKEIFKVFKWETCELKDVDWKCEFEHHSKKTHPSDVVFHYIHPYTGNRVYINTDLKSYKKTSISKGAIQKALNSLAMAVECSNVSKDWQDKYYVDEDYQSETVGLLFIYNNDNQFDKDFRQYLIEVDREKLNIAKGNKLFVFGPDDINYLLTVAGDIRHRIADELLPRGEDYTFYYPDLVLNKRHGEEWGQAAIFEYLTAPWMLIKHRLANEVASGYLIYYKRKGSTVDEFVYFLDTLSHYQLLLQGEPIVIRFVGCHSGALNNFNKAKREYLKSWGEDAARKKQLDNIEAGSVTRVVAEFNPMEVGMRD